MNVARIAPVAAAIALWSAVICSPLIASVAAIAAIAICTKVRNEMRQQ